MMTTKIQGSGNVDDYHDEYVDDDERYNYDDDGEEVQGQVTFDKASGKVDQSEDTDDDNVGDDEDIKLENYHNIQ